MRDEKLKDLAAQVSHLRKQLNAHSIELAAVKKAKPADGAAPEVAEVTASSEAPYIHVGRQVR